MIKLNKALTEYRLSSKRLIILLNSPDFESYCKEAENNRKLCSKLDVIKYQLDDNSYQYHISAKSFKERLNRQLYWFNKPSQLHSINEG